MVLPKASAATPSLGLVAALTELEGKLMSSGSGLSGLWLAAGWIGGVLCPLLTLVSVILTWVLLPGKS